MNVKRFRKTEILGFETLEWFWLLGADGAVSTWFSDVRAVLGRYVCDGVTTHHPCSPRIGHAGCMEQEETCQFLEAPCCYERGSMRGLLLLEQAYTTGDENAVWTWLEGEYARAFSAEEVDA